MMYALAKKFYSIALKSFYSKIDVEGVQRIPRDKPVLFISNHCNAFIDPLLLTANTDRRINFTAKSTLAQNPLLNATLKAFSVELLYRQTDRTVGDNSAARNQAALHRLEERLSDNGCVYIFPEGCSHNDNKMREFKTGAARLALSYAQRCAEAEISNELLIVPLGLNYDNKSGFRTAAHIHVGEPMSLDAWLNVNGNHDAKALTDEFKSMVETALESQKQCARKKALRVHQPTSSRAIGVRAKSWLYRFVKTPLAALGALANLLPFVLTYQLVKHLSTDHDHPASASVVVGPPIFGIAHTLQAMGAALLGSWLLFASYLLLLIPASICALFYIDKLYIKPRYNRARSSAVLSP